MKRHLVFPLQFDSRALFLDREGEGWTEQVAAQHRERRERLVQELAAEFGSDNLDAKVANFRELGPLPFSIIAYHNRFHQQARNAFVVGAYYPALTGACALAERILNHLILDLRAKFKNTAEYKKVYRKESFDDWKQAVNVLSAWNIIRGELPKSFMQLNRIRNDAIHFNVQTYSNERAGALSALELLAEIIAVQFGFFGGERWWAVPGTSGAQFVSASAEKDPFISHYYIPQSPLVGPYYAIKFVAEGILFLDRDGYPETRVSDEEFASLYQSRKSDEVVSSEFPLPSGVRPIGLLMRDGKYLPAQTGPDGTGWAFQMKA